MKSIFVSMILVLSLFSVVHAEEKKDYFPDAWGWHNTIMELSFIGLTAIEWRQSYRIMNNPELGPQTNPIYGKRPNWTRMCLINSWAIMGHFFVAWNISDPWRTIWQMSFIGWQVHQVALHYEHHVNAGITVKF